MVNLRAAIVGCGRIASTDHAAAHTADPRVHLVAVVDPDHDRARALARRSGVREVFTSLDEMLATTDVDLVTLCAPPHLNAPLATTALRAGCHVLCDQPAATDSTDLARLTETATAHHRVLTFASPYRHLTEAQMSRALVDAGEIGEVHDVQLIGPHCGEASGRGRRRGWGWEEVGGGFLDRPLAADAPPAPYGACDPLPDIGIHLLDLAMWITGFPEAVETLWPTHELWPAHELRPAHERNLGRGEGTGRVGDGHTALVRCHDGMALSLSTSYSAHPADEETVRVRLLGDRGALEVFPLTLSHSNPPAPRHTRLPLPGKPGDLRLAHRRQIAAFVDACLGRGPVPVTAAEALHVQDIVDRLQRSAHGTTVPGQSDAREAGAVHGKTDVRGHPGARTTTPTSDDDFAQEASRA